jgi:uncharacterized membrane protein
MSNINISPDGGAFRVLVLAVVVVVLAVLLKAPAAAYAALAVIFGAYLTIVAGVMFAVVLGSIVTKKAGEDE